MEHNFNPNKGDYKYILEDEERKEAGQAKPLPISTKQKLNECFWNCIVGRLIRSTFQMKKQTGNAENLKKSRRKINFIT